MSTSIEIGDSDSQEQSTDQYNSTKVGLRSRPRVNSIPLTSNSALGVQSKPDTRVRKSRGFARRATDWLTITYTKWKLELFREKMFDASGSYRPSPIVIVSATISALLTQNAIPKVVEAIYPNSLDLQAIAEVVALSVMVVITSILLYFDRRKVVSSSNGRVNREISESRQVLVQQYDFCYP